jgi:hypothetical protein
MADYISREAFKGKYLCCGYLPEMPEKEFDEFPAADVEPVVHGRLLRTGIDEYYGEFAECSVCGWDNMANAKYCSGCGAKMDLEGEN